MPQSTLGDTPRRRTGPPRPTPPSIPTVDYERAFRVLERCDNARSLTDFKERVVEALGSVMGFRDVSFFAGPTFPSIFSDSTPVVTGRTASMLPQYHETWYRHDMFGTPTAMRMLQSSGAASLNEIHHHPAVQTASAAYIRHFLQGTWGFDTAAAVRVELHENHTGLIGIFGVEAAVFGPREMATLRAMARQLSAVGRGIPFAPRQHDCSALTPRQRDVAHLLAEGYSNARIAEILSVAEESVKKYVTRILATSGCSTRMELALLIRSGPCSVTSPR